MRLRHFGSYMGVVLCACVLIGMLGLSRAINEIYEASRLEYQERMELAVEDLCSQQEILENVLASLRPGGCFTTFAYLQGLMLPAGRRFRKRLCEIFDKVETTPVVWRNLPPAFVYRCRSRE